MAFSFTFKTKFFLCVLEAAILLALIVGWINIYPDTNLLESIAFRPVPDAAEYAYMAKAFSRGLSPLLPIANELHPSAYSPAHPLLMSLLVRLRGGNFEAIFDYPFYAILIGAFLLYLWMVLGGMSILWRLGAVYLILYSPLLLKTASTIMQESSVFLLFSAANLLVFAGMILYARKGENVSHKSIWANRAGAGLIFASGIFAAAAICMRPTNMPLMFLYAALLFLAFPRRMFFKTASFFAAGCALAFALEALYIHHVAGFWDITAYRHWGMGKMSEFFGLHFAAKPPLNIQTNYTNLNLYYRELFGYSQEITCQGKNPPFFLLAAGLLGMIAFIAQSIAQKKSHQTEPPETSRPENWIQRVFYTQCGLLFIFAILVFFAHSIYFFHDVRFFILVFPVFIIFGLAGCDIIAKRFWQTPKTRVLSLLFIFSMAINSFDLLDHARNMEHLKELNAMDDAKRWHVSEYGMHTANKAVMQKLDCPIYVFHLPVLVARLHWDLLDYPYPIVPMLREQEIQWEPHGVQMAGAKRIKSPRGYVNDPAQWTRNPFYSFLYDPFTKLLRPGALDTALSHYGKIALYFPAWDERHVAPLLKHIQKEKYPA